MRWIGVMLAGLLVVTGVAAQDAYADYEIEPGYVISFPDHWDITFDEHAIGGTNNTDYVYAYSPVMVDAPTDLTDPVDVLDAVIVNFMQRNFPFSPELVQTLEMPDGRTIAYYDYATLFGGSSVNVRFIIVPLDDGTFGAVNVLTTLMSAQLFWGSYEPIVVSFNATNTSDSAQANGSAVVFTLIASWIRGLTSLIQP